MVEIKTGDILKHTVGTAYKVVALTEQWAILKSQRSGEEYAEEIKCLKNYTKVEPFFEVGKTYTFPALKYTFDVHYVGYLGATKDNHKYAAGQYNAISGPAVIMRTDFTNWTEV